MSASVIADGRRLRGDASRRAVLVHATDIASTDGLDGLTIGRLAEASGVSKSGIATLFGSKEALQLATVAAARDVFRAHVIDPARTRPRGVRRIATLLGNSLEYSRARVFSGGCFFAAVSADMDSKPGPVRDAIRVSLREWYDYVGAQVGHARAAGELSADDEPGLLAFELLALNDAANARSLLVGSEEPYRFAAAGMRARLEAAGAPVDALDALRLG